MERETNNRRYWECTRKIRYAIRSTASRALSLLKKKHHSQSRNHVYRCRFCSGYHIGRQPRKESHVKKVKARNARE